MCKWCRTLTPLAAALRGSGSRRRFAATSYAHSTNRSTACRLTSRRESAGRGRPKLELRAHISGRVLTIRNMPNSIPFGAHSRLMPIRDRCQLVVPWLWLVYAESLAPMRLMDWRGLMRRIGATCTAAKTHARSQVMPAWNCHKNGAAYAGHPRRFVEIRYVASQRPIAWIAEVPRALCPRQPHIELNVMLSQAEVGPGEALS